LASVAATAAIFRVAVRVDACAATVFGALTQAAALAAGATLIVSACDPAAAAITTIVLRNENSAAIIAVVEFAVAVVVDAVDAEAGNERSACTDARARTRLDTAPIAGARAFGIVGTVLRTDAFDGRDPNASSGLTIAGLVATRAKYARASVVRRGDSFGVVPASGK
jgi:hypothetical protein